MRDEIINHAALNRARAVQRVERGQILNARGQVTLQNVAHAVRFKLKNSRGVAAREKRVGRRIIERQRGQIQVQFAILLDHPHGIFEHGQRGQPQEIHFQQADAPQRIHVVLRRDFILARLVQRHDFRQRLRRNHHSGGVRRSMARQPLQPQRYLDQFLDLLVLARRLQLRRLFQRLFE